MSAKTSGSNIAAGCFTQAWVCQLVIGALEEAVSNGWLQAEEVTPSALEGFLTTYGRAFYRIAGSTSATEKIVLEKEGEVIPQTIRNDDGSVVVVPFRSGEHVWSLRWKSVA